jgi:hypothetical protein
MLVMNTGISSWSFWVTNRGNVTWMTSGSFTVTLASARPIRVAVATTAITRSWPRYCGTANGIVSLPSAPIATTPENIATDLTGWTRLWPSAPPSAPPSSPPPVFDDAPAGWCSIVQPIVS